jgi:Sec-independent protein translocase protein TatA
MATKTADRLPRLKRDLAAGIHITRSDMAWLIDEIERLRADDALAQKIVARQDAEVERLRAALDEIAALGNGPLGEIARRALGTWQT